MRTGYALLEISARLPVFPSSTNKNLMSVGGKSNCPGWMAASIGSSPQLLSLERRRHERCLEKCGAPSREVLEWPPPESRDEVLAVVARRATPLVQHRSEVQKIVASTLAAGGRSSRNV